MDNCTPLILGATYRRVSDNATFVLAAVRSRRRIVLQSGHGAPLAPIGTEEFRGGFVHDSCNHRDHCCALHGTHAAPHRGCILR